MHVKVRNVCEALYRATLLMTGRESDCSPLYRTTSRAGDTWEYPGPVLTSYSTPSERVLFDPNRDANPFFHFFESLWMLAGRRDAAFLSQFTSRMAQYAEDDGYLHGAYGYRWRHFFHVDQLHDAIEILSRDPTSRRVVLQMWSCQADLDADDKRDIPCNTHVYFRVRGGSSLETTVCCRSNDVILGAYGANAVHFSYLHEYVATRAGLRVGPLHQLSNSWHFYDGEPKTKLLMNRSTQLHDRYGGDYFAGDLVSPYRLRTDRMMGFEEDLVDFFEDDADVVNYRCSFFREVVRPMMHAWLRWRRWRDEESTALPRPTEWTESIKASDWRVACREWIERRVSRRQENVR